MNLFATWLFSTIAFSALIFANQTVHASDNLETALTICKDFGCKTTSQVLFSESHWQKIEQLFAGEISSEQHERAIIAQAIGTFEQLVGPLTNTEQEKGGNIDGYGLPGQMDCIDESTNTTTYLTALEQRGLLKWHIVGKRAYRRPWILDQHWSATIQSRNSSERWVVDSWFLDNGKQPYVQALEQWYDKETFPANPDAGVRKKPKRLEVSR